MKLNVLISCMHETDTSIVARSNIQTDAVVVNQCDTNSVIEYDFTNNKSNDVLTYIFGHKHKDLCIVQDNITAILAEV